MRGNASGVVLAAMLAGAALAACSTTAGVHPEYVTAQPGASPSVTGHAVIIVDRKQTVTASPQSLTGAAWTLTEPVGEIMATTAQTVFGSAFSGGAELADQPKPDAYAVGLKLQDFSYKYDQLSNLGFAITPKVTVAVDADVTLPAGKPGLHKSYTRKDVSGGTYLASLQPPEKINRALHQALGDIFREVARDVAALQGR